MKIGQRVTYLNNGAGRLAVITAVVGAGLSGYKRLGLSLSERLGVLDVPHEGDAAAGADCWALLDESRHAAHPPEMIGRSAQPAIPPSPTWRRVGAANGLAGRNAITDGTPEESSQENAPE